MKPVTDMTAGLLRNESSAGIGADMVEVHSVRFVASEEREGVNDTEHVQIE